MNGPARPGVAGPPALVRLFWRNFFRLVVFTAALAQWACAAWLLVFAAGVHVPWPLHVAAPFALHAVNRLVLGGRPGARARSFYDRPFARAYVGVVFTSLFGMLALAANALAWGAAAALAGAAGGLGLPVSAADLAGPAGWSGSAALAAVSAMMAWGYGPGQRKVEIVELEVLVDGLDPAFDGFVVVQISDIHLGGYMDAARLARHVEMVNALGADLVCITGDITDGLDHAPETFPVLGRLAAPCGVWAVLGNHDVYTGDDAVTEALGRWTGIGVLRNRATAIRRGDACFHLLGVDDAGLDWTRGVREHEALPPLVSRVREAGDGQPMLLLSHRPDLFEQAAGLGMALVLSGHTHGGQIALPWPSARPASFAGFISNYPRGTYRLAASTLHVNLGLGMTGQPVRVCSPREITRITLRPRRA